MTPLIGLAALAVTLTAIFVWVVYVETRTPAQTRRQMLTARIEAIRLAELEAMWQTPAHETRRR